jgi:membrane-associated phospholipid phosphatase
MLCQRLYPIVFVVILLSAGSVRAQDEDPAEPPEQEVAWQPQWSAVHWAEYPLVVAAITLPFWGGLLVPPQDEARVRGGILIDEPIRDVLYLESVQGREDADLISDIIWPIVKNYSLIDLWFVVPVLHEEPALAWKMTWIHAEAMGIAAVLTWPIGRFTGRERPIGADCDRDSSYSTDCEIDNRYRSFFSGHVATAVAGAGLTCVHHQNLPIYGDGWANHIPCIASIGGAAAVGVLRIMADKHYFSDVLIGAVVGFGAGYLWPSLVRYRGDAEESGNGTRATIVPWGDPTSIGVSVIGQSM